MLLTHHRKKLLAVGYEATASAVDVISSWAQLAKALKETDSRLKDLPEDALLPGLWGVASKGNNPQKVIRRIPESDSDKAAWEKLKSTFETVERQPSGRSPNVGEKEKSVKYVEIPIDLIKCAVLLYKDFPAWEQAYFWRLADAELPRLEELRLTISQLLNQLNFCTPSPEERAAYLPAGKVNALDELSEREWSDRYATSLEPVIAMTTPASLSLLAALATESFITDNDVLLHIHRDAFWRSARHLLADPALVDIREEFETLVMMRILLGNWTFPAAFHVSSVRAPLMPMDVWKELTGVDAWVSMSS